MTRRILALVLLALLPATAAAQDWRPQRPDRLAALDAAMAPLLVDFQPTLDAVSAEITTLTAFVSIAAPAAMLTDMEARVAAARALVGRLDDLQALAASALAVLDANPPDPCFAQYHAVLTSGWLLVGDSTQSVEAGDFQSANVQLGSGAYLLRTYGTLVWAEAREACAA